MGCRGFGGWFRQWSERGPPFERGVLGPLAHGGRSDRYTRIRFPIEKVPLGKKNDPLALDTMQEVGSHLAVGTANLINIFNPELVVLGGELSICGPWLLPVVTTYLRENILLPLRDTIRLEVSTQGLDASVIGAVALVLDDIVREPLYAS